MMKFTILSFISVAGLLCLNACTGNKKQTIDNYTSANGDTLTIRTELLSLVGHNGYTIAEVRNPWNESRLLGRYILVEDETSEYPTDGTVLHVPLQRSLVYSGVHYNAISDIHQTARIAGVAEAGYIFNPEVAERISTGTLTDVGSSMSPSQELIIAMQPDAVLVSPYENAGHGLIEQSGAVIIEMADYMESSPLARAEWIKLIGKLYGNYSCADSIFTSTVEKYDSIRNIVNRTESRPKVITNTPISGIWYVPGGRSYMARMLTDAGAIYPWADDTASGSLPLDFPAVYAKANDADIWLTTTYGYSQTKTTILECSTLNERMRPYQTNKIFFVDTKATPYFDIFPFHPDVLLSDMVAIFHPELNQTDSLTFYRQICEPATK